MTEAVSLKPDLGRFGVWLAFRSMKPELAAQIERSVMARPGSAVRRMRN